MGDPVYTRSYRPGLMWKLGYVTEVIGPRRYRVQFLNEDPLWYRYQNQLCYHHMEDDNIQSAKITKGYHTSPITGDSPSVFPHHEESAEDGETTVSDSTPATDESSRGACRYPLQDH